MAGDVEGECGGRLFDVQDLNKKERVFPLF